MKKLLLQIALCCFVSFAFAQDAHFTQFWLKPLELNPALTGSLEGKYRLAVLHRNQWKSVMGSNPFKTYTASFDMRFDGGFDSNDSWGLGLSLFNDRGGFHKYGSNQFGLNFGYHKFLGDIGWEGHHQVSLGFSALYSDRSVNYGDITFNNMYDETTGEYTGALTENLPRERKTYTDFNTGLTYEFYLDKRTNFYAGIVANHLTQPNIGFTKQESKLPMRFVFHGGARLPIIDLMDVQPRILVMKQGAYFECMYGANLRFVIDDSEKETAIYAGAQHRLVTNVNGFRGDAFCLNAGFEIANLQLGVAYDINVSDLNKASNGRGAYELSLIFTGGELSNGSVNCPKF